MRKATPGQRKSPSDQDQRWNPPVASILVNTTGNSITTAPPAPAIVTSNRRSILSTLSPRAITGTPTSIQPARKKKLPQISHAEMVPGPWTTMLKTIPENSHTMPSASKEQDIRRRNGTGIELTVSRLGQCAYIGVIGSMRRVAGK